MPDTTLTTSRPWHRRSRLWPHEAEIRRLRSEGYSLRQITDRLGLGVTRQALHEFLRRADAARDSEALRVLGIRSTAAPPSAAVGGDNDFSPPTRSRTTK